MEKKEIVVVETDSGTVELSPDIVRRYLVSGQGPVTDQEVMMFVRLCQYRRLNPFLREAYLIKYGNSPATIVVGKDAYLRRARSIPECRGYSAGVVCQCKETGEMLRTKGLCPPGCTLVGGWAQVKVSGWDEPLELEVSLTEYLGRTKDGQVSGMWRDKPATMIRKVALVQALREAFPAEFGGMYSQEEIVPEELPIHPILPQEKEDGHLGRVTESAVQVREEVTRAVASPSAPAGGDPEGQSPDQVAGRGKRVRRHKFPVDASVFGSDTLMTCGATPDQLLILKQHAAERGLSEKLKADVKAMTGYDQLSYLREDEAIQLIERYAPKQEGDVIDVMSEPEGQNKANTIRCDAHGGDLMDVEKYCLAGKCRHRNRDGWCPILGETPPVSEEEVF